MAEPSKVEPAAEPVVDEPKTESVAEPATTSEEDEEIDIPPEVLGRMSGESNFPEDCPFDNEDECPFDDEPEEEETPAMSNPFEGFSTGFPF